MQIIEAYKPFDIQEINLTEWKQRPVKNNFFELVLIQEGAGTQCINYHDYTYGKGSIFLLPPLKCHSFQITEPTRFVFLKFTSNFFKNYQRDGVNRSAWFKEASYILSNYNQLPGDIIKSELDRQHLSSLVQLILQENRNYQVSSAALIQSLMTSILEILLRNIKTSLSSISPQQHQDERINKLLQYINDHLQEPALLKVNLLAKEFLLSPTYLSEFFRKNVGVPLREYIIKARLKQVEIRLLHSELTLTEIAEELSYTDVSHLSKTFKRYTGLSMREFKKRGEYQILKRNYC